MIGSCFTENIGNKLAELKYNIDINPFGILYNPASVINSIQYLIEKKNSLQKIYLTTVESGIALRTTVGFQEQIRNMFCPE